MPGSAAEAPGSAGVVLAVVVVRAKRQELPGLPGDVRLVDDPG